MTTTNNIQLYTLHQHLTNIQQDKDEHLKQVQMKSHFKINFT